METGWTMFCGDTNCGHIHETLDEAGQCGTETFGDRTDGDAKRYLAPARRIGGKIVIRDDGDWIVVLNDGETWTALEGCKLVHIPIPDVSAMELLHDYDFEEWRDTIADTIGADAAKEVVEFNLEAIVCSTAMDDLTAIVEQKKKLGDDPDAAPPCGLGTVVEKGASGSTRKVRVSVTRIVHDLGDFTLEVPATATDDDISEWVSTYLDGDFDDESIRWDNNTYDFDVNYIVAADPDGTPDAVLIETEDGLKERD